MSDVPPEEFKNIEDLLKRVLSQAFNSGSIKPGLVGVNIIMAGGPMPGGNGNPFNTSGSDVEHPTIEVAQWNGKVSITCELKGLSDEHIKVALADGALHIIGFNGKLRYRNSAKIPPVIESSCNRTFENGVLELTYLIKPDEDKCVEVYDNCDEESDSIKNIEGCAKLDEMKNDSEDKFSFKPSTF